jgi:hypothetical protein
MSLAKGISIIAAWLLAWIWIGALVLPSIESFPIRTGAFFSIVVVCLLGNFVLCHRFATGKWS